MKTKVLPTLSNVLDAISDKYSREMLEVIATNECGDVLAETLQISRKQFYSRISDLTTCGLIKGRDGKYSLTPFGKIVYNVQRSISKAVDNRWKFKALDSLRDNDQLSEVDFARTVDTLVDDIHLKDMILNKRS